MRSPRRGYRLRAKYIIHTVGPIYKKDDNNLLADCYWNCLELAKQHDIHSIAFPTLSTGRFCFPKEKAAHMTVGTIRRWMAENMGCEIQVILSCVDHRIYEIACAKCNQYWCMDSVDHLWNKTIRCQMKESL